uniref:C-type lectin domain-containing protein n=1 Tax=Acrobeloides nanus TaxID=290746 RepID=A0A914DDX6_9BILA
MLKPYALTMVVTSSRYIQLPKTRSLGLWLLLWWWKLLYYNWYDGTSVDYTGWVPFAPDTQFGPCVYVANVANHSIGWDNFVAYVTCTIPCASCSQPLKFVCESNLISVG